MATKVFTDGRLYAGAYNLSGQTNQVTMEIEADELDVSSIQDAWDATVLGRKRATLAVNGWWASGAGLPDNLFTLLGTSGVVCTVLPSGTDGEIGYAVQALPVKYSPGPGEAGGVIPFSVEAKGNVGRAIKGTVLHDDSAAVTTTGNGTGRQLGAVAAGQRVYASLHVFDVSGGAPTLDVTLESDTAGFASPSTRITFAQATAATSEWKEVAGAITDDWWRVVHTVGGTTPSFKYVILVAIL